MSGWKEDLLKELRNISDKHSIKIEKAFIFWYIKATENISDNSILECITDRSKDAGCDAVIFNSNLKLIKILQSKFSENIGEGGFNKDELAKLSKVYEFIRIGKSDNEEMKDYIHKQLKEKLERAIRFIKEDGYRLKVDFITTLRNNANADIYSFPELNIYSDKEISMKYEEWKHGQVPDLGDILINYVDIMDGPQCQPKSYIVDLTSESLRKEFQIHKDGLFSRNVRIFYGDKKKTNKEMKQTLAKNPANFWFYNNGITLLSEKVTVDKENKLISLRNPQIINGCQTVSVIGESKPTSANVLAKIIEIQDDVSNQSIIDGIIESNNRQTHVDERMLKSNHPCQVKLHRELELLKYYYERKEGQYKEEKARINRISELECIKNIDLVRCNIAICKPPHVAHESEDTLFSTHFDDVFINSKAALEYLLPYLIWCEIANIGYYHRRGSRKRFNRLSSYIVLRIYYDFCTHLLSSIKLNDIYRLLISSNYEFDKNITEQIFDIVYKEYDKSEFTQENSGQRDFCKKKDTYDIVSAKIPKYLQNQINESFNI
jgi:AIPR protein.